MKRLVASLAIASLFLLGFGLGANAQSTRPSPTASESVEGRTSPMARQTLRELRRIQRLAPDVSLCSTVKANSDVSKLIDCLNRLTKFAKSTQSELDALNKFVTQFFGCTSYSQLTQYGDPLGSQGYVYDPGTGVTFKITALDFTFDVATEAFLNFYVLKPTIKCLAFAQ